MAGYVDGKRTPNCSRKTWRDAFGNLEELDIDGTLIVKRVKVPRCEMDSADSEWGETAGVFEQDNEFRVPGKGGAFLTSWAAVSFSEMERASWS
jgi:hypothetical protein